MGQPHSPGQPRPAGLWLQLWQHWAAGPSSGLWDFPSSLVPLAQGVTTWGSGAMPHTALRPHREAGAFCQGRDLGAVCAGTCTCHPTLPQPTWSLPAGGLGAALKTLQLTPLQTLLDLRPCPGRPPRSVGVGAVDCGRQAHDDRQACLGGAGLVLGCQAWYLSTWLPCYRGRKHPHVGWAACTCILCATGSSDSVIWASAVAVAQ